MQDLSISLRHAITPMQALPIDTHPSSILKQTDTKVNCSGLWAQNDVQFNDSRLWMFSGEVASFSRFHGVLGRPSSRAMTSMVQLKISGDVVNWETSEVTCIVLITLYSLNSLIHEAVLLGFDFPTTEHDAAERKPPPRSPIKPPSSTLQKTLQTLLKRAYLEVQG